MTLLDQIRHAFERSGWTMKELGKRARLGSDASSISRKLSGDTRLTTTEAEKMARALGVRISAGNE